MIAVVRRRELLRAGLAGSLAVLAGCRSSGDTGDRGRDSSRDWQGSPTPSRARPAIQASFDVDTSSDTPIAVEKVGSREAVSRPEGRLPWMVDVWNDHDGERAVDVSVVGESLGRAVDRTVTLPARAYYRVELLEPDRYAMQVRSPDRPRYEFRVPETAFDCNDHAADLRVSPTGVVEYVTTSTAVACAPPEEYPTRGRTATE